jgi:hypothetical protein
MVSDASLVDLPDGLAVMTGVFGLVWRLVQTCFPAGDTRQHSLNKQLYCPPTISGMQRALIDYSIGRQKCRKVRTNPDSKFVT